MTKLSTRRPDGSHPRTENEIDAEVGIIAALSRALRDVREFEGGGVSDGDGPSVLAGELAIKGDERGFLDLDLDLDDLDFPFFFEGPGCW